MKRLSDLDTKEVSLVPRGANKKKFLVMKAELTSEGRKHIAGSNFAIPGERKYPIHDISHARNALSRASGKPEEAKVKAAVYRKYPSLKPGAEKGEQEMPAPDKKVRKDAGDMMPKKDSAVYKEPGEHEGHDMDPRMKQALKAMGRIAAPFAKDMKPEHVMGALKEVGIGHGNEELGDRGEGHGTDEGHPQHQMSKELGSWAIPEGVSDEHHAEALDMATKKGMKKAEKAYKKALSKLGYRKYPDEEAESLTQKAMSKPEDDADEDEEDEEVGKSSISKAALSSFAPEQRKLIEGIFKDHSDLVKKNMSLEKQLSEQKEEQRNKEIVAKAAEFSHIGLAQEEIVETLKDADKAGTKTYDRICKQFEVMNEQAEKGGLFKEIGHRGHDSAADAQAKLDALVDSIVKKSDGKTTFEQAYDDVMKSAEGKKLYAQHVEEREQRRKR